MVRLTTSQIECALEAETSVSNLTQYKPFIGDDKKICFLELPSPLRTLPSINNVIWPFQMIHICKQLWYALVSEKNQPHDHQLFISKHKHKIWKLSLWSSKYYIFPSFGCVRNLTITVHMKNIKVCMSTYIFLISIEEFQCAQVHRRSCLKMT